MPKKRNAVQAKPARKKTWWETMKSKYGFSVRRVKPPRDLVLAWVAPANARGLKRLGELLGQCVRGRDFSTAEVAGYILNVIVPAALRVLNDSPTAPRRGA